MAHLSGEARQAYVADLFARIAGRYDLMNSLMTGGMHHHWKRVTARTTAEGLSGPALDIATGTGDLAFSLAQQPGIDKAVGVDLLPEMLTIAQHKRNRRVEDRNTSLCAGRRASFALSRWRLCLCDGGLQSPKHARPAPGHCGNGPGSQSGRTGNHAGTDADGPGNQVPPVPPVLPRVGAPGWPGRGRRPRRIYIPASVGGLLPASGPSGGAFFAGGTDGGGLSQARLRNGCHTLRHQTDGVTVPQDGWQVRPCDFLMSCARHSTKIRPLMYYALVASYTVV